MGVNDADSQNACPVCGEEKDRTSWIDGRGNGGKRAWFHFHGQDICVEEYEPEA